MKESVTYRLELARGFLREAQQDLTLQRWRFSVSHAQLAVENSLKAVISFFSPVAKTHDPARILLELNARQQIPAQWQPAVQKLAEMGQPLDRWDRSCMSRPITGMNAAAVYLGNCLTKKTPMRHLLRLKESSSRWKNSSRRCIVSDLQRLAQQLAEGSPV